MQSASKQARLPQPTVEMQSASKQARLPQPTVEMQSASKQARLPQPTVEMQSCSRYTFPGFSAYSMSKHAAVSFADCLRLEMRKWNISVHTVEPTLYRTPITNVENLHRSLDQTWQECPAEVRRSYGQEYLKDFKVTVNNHMSNAKPSEKIKEVIADMVDAVAGQEPLIRCRLLSTLPAKMRDTLLLKGHPKTPPAFLAARHSYTPSERCDGPGARTREVIDLVVSLFQRAARNTRLCWTRVSDSASTVAAWPAITPCPTLRKTKSLRRRSQRRLKRTSLSIEVKKEESSAVKLGFAGTLCPSHIYSYVGSTRYAVFPFNATPRRCYRCQRLGHVAVNCNSPLCCLVCSGLHTKNEYTAEPGQEKCANCHQTHIVSSKECPAIRNAATIQKLQRSRVGFEAAKYKVMKTQTELGTKVPFMKKQNLTVPIVSPNIVGSQHSIQGYQQENQNDLTVQKVMVDIHQSGDPTYG
ncbi:Short-chain dehydrogenase/reductase SDR [Trinorchestia longiramus]|nr:Short-chain dehydrogenase/reductase SDR [Trinorchestia longiramus]